MQFHSTKSTHENRISDCQCNLGRSVLRSCQSRILEVNCSLLCVIAPLGFSVLRSCAIMSLKEIVMQFVNQEWKKINLVSLMRRLEGDIAFDSQAKLVPFLPKEWKGERHTHTNVPVYLEKGQITWIQVLLKGNTVSKQGRLSAGTFLLGKQTTRRDDDSNCENDGRVLHCVMPFWAECQAMLQGSWAFVCVCAVCLSVTLPGGLSQGMQGVGLCLSPGGQKTGRGWSPGDSAPGRLVTRRLVSSLILDHGGASQTQCRGLQHCYLFSLLRVQPPSLKCFGNGQKYFR